jgi:hypothetical protein
LSGLTSITSTAITGSLQGSISGNAATVTTNANLTGVVTSTGNATTIANGNITNVMLAGSIANDKLVNSSFHVGTTSISLGRASAVQTLTGVSIDGNATSETLATVTARGASTSTSTTFSGGLTTNTLSFTAPSGDPSPVITTRVVPSGQGAAAELTELILFHSNDPNNGAGPDYITLRSPAIRFQTYNNAAVTDITNNLGSNDRIRIEPDGTIKLSSLTSNGFVKTSASDGTLSVDTNTYLTANQTITLSGVVTGSGTTSITTAIANGVISNAMLANSSFFIGTTSISLGRASAAQTLAGVSVDGNAATATEVIRTVAAASEANLLYATIADNDYFRIRVGGASNAGFVEIATADDATEPIHVRQYSGTFATLTRTATLLDGIGNTSFPGTVTAPTFSGALSGNASTVTNGVYTTGDQTIGGAKTFSSNITNSSAADWYMYGFGARGASSGQYGVGLTADIANRTLSFHVPNLAAYSNSGSTPKFGWYSNGSVELMTLQSATGNLVVTGTIGAFNLSGTNTGDQTLSGLGGQPQLNGTGFVKVVGTTVSYDNSTYYLASNPNGYITSSASSLTLTGNLTVSSGNSTGGGIILADDGDIVDLNDAFCSMRFSSGVRIFSANRGGSAVITLGSNGVVTATTFSGALSGNATTATTAGALTSMNISQFTNNSGYLTNSTNGSVRFNPYTSAGTVSSPVFQDAILLGPSENQGKIQFGNEFQNTHGSYIRFQVNSNTSQNAPTTALTLFPSGFAVFNGNVLPSANGTLNLGSSGARWNTIFTSDLSMSNGIGDYTIVEGEEDLFIYNNKTNKVFKFLLQEVDPSIAPAKKVH